MIERTVKTEQDRALLLRLIERHKLPFTATVTDGKRRTIEQNKLQRLWLKEVSEQTGETTEEVRSYWKLAIGVPILRNENAKFKEIYDKNVKGLPYEQKIALMAEPLDMPVTRLMTARQKTGYLDQIYRHYSEQGIALTVPDDMGLERAHA